MSKFVHWLGCPGWMDPFGPARLRRQQGVQTRAPHFVGWSIDVQIKTHALSFDQEKPHWRLKLSQRHTTRLSWSRRHDDHQCRLCNVPKNLQILHPTQHRLEQPRTASTYTPQRNSTWAVVNSSWSLLDFSNQRKLRSGVEEKVRNIRDRKIHTVHLNTLPHWVGQMTPKTQVHKRQNFFQYCICPRETCTIYSVRPPWTHQSRSSNPQNHEEKDPHPHFAQDYHRNGVRSPVQVSTVIQKPIHPRSDDGHIPSLSFTLPN